MSTGRDWNKEVQDIISAEYHIGECPPAPPPGLSLEEFRAAHGQGRAESTEYHPSAYHGMGDYSASPIARQVGHKLPGAMKAVIVLFALGIAGYIGLTAWLYGG